VKYSYIYIASHTCMHKHAHSHAHPYTHTCKHTHSQAHTQIHTYTHIQHTLTIHTYTHTQAHDTHMELIAGTHAKVYRLRGGHAQLPGGWWRQGGAVRGCGDEVAGRGSGKAKGGGVESEAWFEDAWSSCAVCVRVCVRKGGGWRGGGGMEGENFNSHTRMFHDIHLFPPGCSPSLCIFLSLSLTLAAHPVFLRRTV